MGTIHQLPLASNAHARLLESMVRTAIDSHPDKAVAQSWSRMAIDTLERYAYPPLPSQSLLDLDRVPGLSREQGQLVEQLVEEWMLSYFDDVREQLMNIHRELLMLQKRVAELENDYVAARQDEDDVP